MLKTIVALSCCSAAIFLAPHSASAQTPGKEIRMDSLRTYYTDLIKSEKTEDKDRLAAALNRLSASGNEDDLEMAINIYRMKGQRAQGDSVTAIAVKRFPKGQFATSQAYSAAKAGARSAAEMITAYNKFIAEFPESATAGMTHEIFRADVVMALAKEKNVAGVTEWTEKLKPNGLKGRVESMSTQALYDAGEKKAAMELLKNIVATRAKDTLGTQPSFNSTFLIQCADYATMLYKDKQYKAAITYAAVAYNAGQDYPKGLASKVYAQSLIALNKPKEALPIMEELVKSGKADGELRKELKTTYTKVKGSDKGFAAYEEALTAKLREDMTVEMKKKMVSEDAPVFSLKNIDGQPVNLASLKGKTVILDFWATWCVPCKNSFPAMQRAIVKYKNDPNVMFLFIDCWERTEDPVQTVKDYIKTTAYTFNILMDEDKKTGVASQYEVKGIPQKFVIDKEGKIRFKITGYGGYEDTAYEELTVMIDMLKG